MGAPAHSDLVHNQMFICKLSVRDLRQAQEASENFKEAPPLNFSTLKHDHQVLILYKDFFVFQKSVKQVLKLCFYLATPTSSLSMPGL